MKDLVFVSSVQKELAAERNASEMTHMPHEPLVQNASGMPQTPHRVGRDHNETCNSRKGDMNGTSGTLTVSAQAPEQVAADMRLLGSRSSSNQASSGS